MGNVSAGSNCGGIVGAGHGVNASFCFFRGATYWFGMNSTQVISSNIIAFESSESTYSPAGIVRDLGDEFILKDNQNEFTAIVLKWTLENII